MGRYYWGDIEGKFWFAVQSSSDISNLIDDISYNESYAWKVCNCSADVWCDNYCSDCYESKEEHIEAAKEEEEYSEEDNLLYTEENTISYDIDRDFHYENLICTLNEIKQHFPAEIMDAFNQIENNDKLLNAFEGAFGKTCDVFETLEIEDAKRQDLAVLMARYTLGLQIKYCLEQNGDCSVYCEC